LSGRHRDWGCNEFPKDGEPHTVTPELLCDVIKAHAEMPAADRPVLEARMVRIFQLLDEKAPKGDLSIAIQFRLEAVYSHAIHVTEAEIELMRRRKSKNGGMRQHRSADHARHHRPSSQLIDYPRYG
jgi:hypothetical protein